MKCEALGPTWYNNKFQRYQEVHPQPSSDIFLRHQLLLKGSSRDTVGVDPSRQNLAQAHHFIIDLIFAYRA